jgi:hypothetical protein
MIKVGNTYIPVRPNTHHSISTNPSNEPVHPVALGALGFMSLLLVIIIVYIGIILFKR